MCVISEAIFSMAYSVCKYEENKIIVYCCDYVLVLLLLLLLLLLLALLLLLTAEAIAHFRRH